MGTSGTVCQQMQVMCVIEQADLPGSTVGLGIERAARWSMVVVRVDLM